MEQINEMIINCPACGAENKAKSIMREIEIPHFGDVLETTIQCSICGFKHSDIISLEQKDPTKYILPINKNTLSVRVVRAQSATVSIPEVGVKVEPGPTSEGYITNVEGVLTRFKDATQKALNLFYNDESQKNAKLTLEKLDNLIKGTHEATLIIKDPFGQSNIIHVSVKTLPILEDELKKLKTGFTFIENNEE